MDIKRELRQIIEGTEPLNIRDGTLKELCRFALAEIESKAEIIRTLRTELEIARQQPPLESQLERHASRMMQAMVWEYSPSKFYDFEAMAKDAVIAARLLVKELREGR